MLNICISFDYELFMGENNASYEDILFSPTSELQQMLNQEKARGVFFADVCSAIVYEDNGLKEYSVPFLNQIRSLCKDGHDIQLHLHPSWYKAELSGRQMLPSYMGYRLHEYGFESSKFSAIDIINEGVDYLNNNLKIVNPNYKCIAYRAGGFAVQPEKEIFSALIKKGVLIDSSIVPHMKNNLVNGFDFSHVPKILNWWIDPNRGINIISAPSKNSIFEVPIATLRPSLFRYLGLSSEKLRLPQSKPLGKYVSNPNENPQKPNPLLHIYKQLFDFRYVSLDTRYYERVIEDLEYIYSKYKLECKDGYVCLICHPKLLDTCRIENIRLLINRINNMGDKFRIVTMQDIYNDIIVYTKYEGAQSGC